MEFSGQGAATGALGGAAAGAAIGLMGGPIGALAGAGLGTVAGGLGLFGGKSSSSKASSFPSFNPQQALDLERQQYAQMAPQALGFQSNAYNQIYPQALNFGSKAFNQAAQQGYDFSQQGTAENIANQNKVTPGSSAQRKLALKQINSYIRGEIPQDVQQNINRQVAQNLGGGFNMFSSGGQAPQNFARNIGQTSLGLSQYGLSAAPTWQQLANTMVVSPTAGLAAGLQSTGMGTSLGASLLGSGTNLVASSAGLGNQLAESQYQGAFNQYQGQQLQNQQQNQAALGLAQLGLQGYSAMNKAGYFNSLTPSAQGRLATLGGIPAATSNLGSLASEYGTPIGASTGMPGTAEFNNFMSSGGWN
jgi:hypothetical protein